MIQKAIIEAIENDYQVKVRIPKYDKMSYDGAGYDELSTGIICSTPGTLVNYSVGDVVLVSFENDEISKPVVLGLLYTDKATESSVKLPSVSTELSSISESLDKIKTAQPYVHIKYSNDGGITFTSLYDYADSEDGTRGSNIPINIKSTYLAWNIVDAKNTNAVDKFNLSVSIRGYKDGAVAEGFSSTEVVTTIPADYNYLNSMQMDYTISLRDPQTGTLDDYYISLVTDKDPIGSVAGDYIGIYYSTSEVPSANPVDYSWAAVKLRVQEFIDDAYEKLRHRIRQNENYLYGIWDETDEDYATASQTYTGINSAVKVEPSKFDISKKDTVKLSNKITVIPKSNMLLFNNIGLIANSDGHLRIQYIQSNE